MEIEYEVYDTVYHVDDDGNYGGADNEVNDDHDVWSERAVEGMVDKLRSGDYMTGMYTAEDAKNVDEHLRNASISGGVEGKRALVIGSQVGYKISSLCSTVLVET